MNFRHTLLFLLLTAIHALSFAQELPQCFYEPDSVDDCLRQAGIAQLNYRKRQGKSLTSFTGTKRIPVVVHVIEPYSSSSLISDATIQAMIANLNAAFGGTGYYDESGSTDIRFELASQDPLCNPSTGIVRYNAATSAQYVKYGVFNDGVTWDLIREWSSWNKWHYMNIWIVHQMNNGAVGVGGPGTGLIARASGVGGGSDDVIVHEVGHYLGLAHTFANGYNNCDCADGDGLADTPPMIPSGVGSQCPHPTECGPDAENAINPCTGTPYGDAQRNIMNYVGVGCKRKFTPDQIALMQWTLANFHVALTTSPGLDTSPQPPAARITGPSSFCIAGGAPPNLGAACTCDEVALLKLNQNFVSEEHMASITPVLSPGMSTVWNYRVTCASGLTASHDVYFYNPGVTDVKAFCNPDGTWWVTFSNTANYAVAASAGVVTGNAVTGIPPGTSVTITVTDANGCGNSRTVESPCCGIGAVTAAACIPPPPPSGTLSSSLGIVRFTLGTIDKSSATAATDASHYIDRSCMYKTSVVAGNAYAFSIYASTTNVYRAGLYIDFNNDGHFNGPGETVMSGSTSGVNGNNVMSGTVTIPANAVQGIPLRVRAVAGIAASVDACALGNAINAGVGQTEDYALVVTDPLPVRLIAFDGKYADDAVKLTWTTDFESENEGFEILKSADARSFERIGFVDGTGSSTQLHSYAFTDRRVQPGLTYYYKLRQIDFDGKSTLSRVISVRTGDGDYAPYVYPNPVNGSQLSLHAPYAALRRVELIGANGERWPVKWLPASGTGAYTVSWKGNLRPGLYQLAVTPPDGGAVMSLPVVIH